MDHGVRGENWNFLYRVMPIQGSISRFGIRLENGRAKRAGVPVDGRRRTASGKMRSRAVGPSTRS
jgi:hypothetical protein